MSKPALKSATIWSSIIGLICTVGLAVTTPTIDYFERRATTEIQKQDWSSLHTALLNLFTAGTGTGFVGTAAGRLYSKGEKLHTAHGVPGWDIEDCTECHEYHVPNTNDDTIQALIEQTKDPI